MSRRPDRAEGRGVFSGDDSFNRINSRPAGHAGYGFRLSTHDGVSLDTSATGRCELPQFFQMSRRVNSKNVIIASRAHRHLSNLLQ